MALDYKAAVNISANFTGQRELDQAKNSVDKLGRSVAATASITGTFKSQLGGLKTAFAAIGAGLVLRETLQFGKAVIDLGDNLRDLSQKTGVGIQALSDLQAAAEDGGVDFAQFESGLKKFTVTLGKAQAGAKDASSGFKALGFSQDDISKFKNSDQALLAIADKFSRIPDGADKAAVAVALFGKTGADLIPVLNGGSEAIEGMGIKVSQAFGDDADAFNDNINKLIRNTKQLGVTIGEALLPPLNKMLEKLNSLDKGFFDDLFATAGAAFSASENGAFDLADNFGKKNFKGEIFGPPLPPKKQDGRVDKSKIVDGDGAKQLEKEADALEKLNLEKQNALELQDLENQRLEYSAEAYEKREKSIKDSLKAEKELVGFSDTAAEQYRKVAGEISAIQAETKALEEQNKRTFIFGAKEAMDSYVNTAASSAALTKQAFNAGFRGLEEALVDFVKTGESSFHKFFAIVSDTLARIAVQKTIAFAVSKFADGGIMSSEGSVPLRKYASGGIADSPQLAMFGEGSTPEAFVPLPDGRSIPVSMKGGAGGGLQNNVQISVHIAQDGAGSSDARANSEQGRQLGKMLSNLITQRLIEEKRPGGMLAAGA